MSWMLGGGSGGGRSNPEHTLSTERNLPRRLLLYSTRVNPEMNTPRCIYLFYLSIYLSISLSIHPSIYVSIYLSIYLGVYLSIFLSIGFTTRSPVARQPVSSFQPASRHLRALLSVCGGCSFGGLGCCSRRVCVCRGCCSLSVCMCVWPVDLFFSHLRGHTTEVRGMRSDIGRSSSLRQ